MSDTRDGNGPDGAVDESESLVPARSGRKRRGLRVPVDDVPRQSFVDAPRPDVSRTSAVGIARPSAPEPAPEALPRTRVPSVELSLDAEIEVEPQRPPPPPPRSYRPPPPPPPTKATSPETSLDEFARAVGVEADAGADELTSEPTRVTAPLVELDFQGERQDPEPAPIPQETTKVGKKRSSAPPEEGDPGSLPDEPPEAPRRISHAPPAMSEPVVSRESAAPRPSRPPLSVESRATPRGLFRGAASTEVAVPDDEDFRDTVLAEVEEVPRARRITTALPRRGSERASLEPEAMGRSSHVEGFDTSDASAAPSEPPHRVRAQAEATLETAAEVRPAALDTREVAAVDERDAALDTQPAALDTQQAAVDMQQAALQAAVDTQQAVDAREAALDAQHVDTQRAAIDTPAPVVEPREAAVEPRVTAVDATEPESTEAPRVSAEAPRVSAEAPRVSAVSAEEASSDTGEGDVRQKDGASALDSEPTRVRAAASDADSRRTLVETDDDVARSEAADDVEISLSEADDVASMTAPDPAPHLAVKPGVETLVGLGAPTPSSPGVLIAPVVVVQRAVAVVGTPSQPPPEPRATLTTPGGLSAPPPSEIKSEEPGSGEALRLERESDPGLPLDLDADPASLADEADLVEVPSQPVPPKPAPPPPAAAKPPPPKPPAPPPATAAPTPERGPAPQIAPPPPLAAEERPQQLPSRPPPKKKHQWWEELFSDDYLRTVPIPTNKAIAKQVDFIEARLGLAKGATILDVGCGLGLHAIELTRRGYLVVGLDLSLPMLSRAADEAQDHGFKINFLHADMREMNFEGAFDAVLLWGTTLGYFDDETNKGVLERIHRALKPGGLLLLEVVNRDFAVKSQPNLVWFQGDGCVVMEETAFNFIASRLSVKRNVILDDGRQRETTYSIRLYSLHELGQVLHLRGFRVVEITGREATPGVYFGADSPKLIILAERRIQAPPAPPKKSETADTKTDTPRVEVPPKEPSNGSDPS